MLIAAETRSWALTLFAPAAYEPESPAGGSDVGPTGAAPRLDGAKTEVVTAISAQTIKAQPRPRLYATVLAKFFGCSLHRLGGGCTSSAKPLEYWQLWIVFAFGPAITCSCIVLTMVVVDARRFCFFMVVQRTPIGGTSLRRHLPKTFM